VGDVLIEYHAAAAYEMARELDRRIMCPSPWDQPWPPEPPNSRWVFFRRLDIVHDGEIYLRRWRLIETPWFGVLLHRIAKPDDGRSYHDHPWSFVSFVLRGWYRELVMWGPEGHPRIFAARRLVRWVTAKRAEDAHRIEAVPPGGAWTLVLRGPRRRTWGFYAPNWIPWHVYLNVTGKSA